MMPYRNLDTLLVINQINDFKQEINEVHSSIEKNCIHDLDTWKWRSLSQKSFYSSIDNLLNDITSFDLELDKVLETMIIVQKIHHLESENEMMETENMMPMQSKQKIEQNKKLIDSNKEIIEQLKNDIKSRWG